jgi:hypothetical protein
MFKCHYRESPFHLQGNQELRPSILQLLRAFENFDPPPKRQKAITPRLLRCLAQYGLTSRIAERSYDHAVDLIIAAFFFAMRSCEYTKTPKEGLTKGITLGNVTFRDDRKSIIKHSDPDLDNKARYVMVRFEAQKNHEKCNVRTQRSTGDYVLCPIRCRRSNLSVSANTPICLFNGSQITSSFTRKLLRKTRDVLGGKETKFGFDLKDIGNHSIWSRAAMALFLMDHHPTKIMILGRWKSREAFMDYIRPQVPLGHNKSDSKSTLFSSYCFFFNRLRQLAASQLSRRLFH